MNFFGEGANHSLDRFEVLFELAHATNGVGDLLENVREALISRTCACVGVMLGLRRDKSFELGGKLFGSVGVIVCFVVTHNANSTLKQLTPIVTAISYIRGTG